jgi:hypothetical protein
MERATRPQRSDAFAHAGGTVFGCGSALRQKIRGKGAPLISLHSGSGTPI